MPLNTSAASGTAPVWAPTTPARIEHALDLAQVRPGDRFVDLGCGDGRVLLAAARRGAEVTGIEIDPPLAERARRLLEEAGVPGDVVVGDIFRADVSADVVFAFLSPATLQRLAPRLARLAPGTRFVSPEFGVEGWRPERVHRRCFLYRTPPQLVELAPPWGWEAAGIVTAIHSGGPSLISVRLRHPQGPVAVAVAGELERFAEATQGADALDAPGAVVIDLRFEAQPAGTILTGRIESGELGSLLVYGAYTDGPVAVRSLADRSACARIAQQLAGPGREPDAVLDQLALAPKPH